MTKFGQKCLNGVFKYKVLLKLEGKVFHLNKVDPMFLNWVLSIFISFSIFTILIALYYCWEFKIFPFSKKTEKREIGEPISRDGETEDGAKKGISDKDFQSATKIVMDTELEDQTIDIRSYMDDVR